MTSEPQRLGPLLAGEISRRVALFENPDADVMDVRAALHALRGSAAMAGEHDLALVLGQMSARVRGGDETAQADIARLLRRVLARLEAGGSAFSERWPEPPEGLGPSVVESAYRSDYAADLRGRIEELDGVAARIDDAGEALDAIYRTVHAVKGSALALGDDSMVWYVHGLESAIKEAVASEEASTKLLTDLTRHRSVLVGLLEDPEATLDSLRAAEAEDEGAAPASSRARHPSVPPPSSRPSAPPPSNRPARPSAPPPAADPTEERLDAPLRVPAAALDLVLQQLDQIDLVQDELLTAAETARRTGSILRDTRGDLLEALRLIGPSRSWSAPVEAIRRIRRASLVLSAAAKTADDGATFVRHSSDRIQTSTGKARGDIAALRRTAVRWVFDRVASTAEALAAREGKLVHVRVEGGDAAIDRSVAERVLDAVMQLARNAVVHGIETPEQRARNGRPPEGCIRLRAESLGDWLRIVVEDDGRGVDVERIRRLAVDHELLTPKEAEGVPEAELLALLFVPGLTTREDADVLAGRGVGLDLTQEVVRRLGGTIRLSRRHGGGLVATIEVPSQAGIAEVLWLGAGTADLALPVGFTGSVLRAADAPPMVHVLDCLDAHRSSRAEDARYVVELTIHGVEPIGIGVDRIGTVEDANVRPLPPLLAESGPYTGAILRGDGTLRLLLDAARLAAKAWARVA